MKLLTPEEVNGIDSTSQTIAKWDKFLKKAVWNLGYKQELIDNMYPYSKGIPMKDGSYMPVSQKTGRVFFKMSWADKFAQVLTTIQARNGEYSISALKYFMFRFWSDDFKNYNRFFKDADEEEYETFRDELKGEGILPNYVPSSIRDMSPGDMPTVTKRWKEFLDNSIIYKNGMSSSSNEYDRVGEIDDSLRTLLEDRVAISMNSYSTLIIYCKLIEDVFDNLSNDDFSEIISQISARADSGIQSRYYSFSEVYLQDYLVISLNPIDKLMCSTKQAFSSCMSIAKQADVTGTSSSPAFGLPSLFASDSVFMTFLTPGKHKNMYWEEDEWKKSPDKRDKEKAYKYLKMTCRSLTYKGDYKAELKEALQRVKALAQDKNNTELLGILDDLHIGVEKLYIGRQYSASGEDFIWQSTIEYLLGIAGISTPMAYSTALDKFKDYAQTNNDILSIMRNRDYFQVNKKIWCRHGDLSTPYPIVTDRYGYVRGIYYDNINFVWHPDVIRCKSSGTFKPRPEVTALPTPAIEAHITTGTSRCGSGGVTWFASSGNEVLDMFKVMNGEQNYSNINSNVKICGICGELIPGNGSQTKYKDKHICPSCMDRLRIKECPSCKELYSETDPEEAKNHVLYNIRELINPKNYKELPPVMVCASKLQRAEQDLDASTSIRQSIAFCAHCGKTIGEIDKETGTFISINRNILIRAKFKGYNIRLQLCPDCIRKAVMCDKCHRLIFLDSIKDACLLLPNRRVICPDCVDSIRLKQEKRAMLSGVLHNLDSEDVARCEVKDVSPQDEVARAIKARGGKIGNESTLVKDVTKQIKSYVQAHPEEGAPVLRESNPVEEQRTEIPAVYILSEET